MHRGLVLKTRAALGDGEGVSAIITGEGFCVEVKYKNLHLRGQVLRPFAGQGGRLSRRLIK